MNRLIIVGNGFDLAHKLPTKYSDFITNYWSNINDSAHSDDFLNFNKKGYDFNRCKSLNDILEHLRDSGDFKNPIIDGANFIYFGSEVFINYTNSFFEKLCNKFQKTNWVDIEMEYYNLLRNIFTADLNEDEDVIFDQVVKLNMDFSQLKDRFNKYLNDNVLTKVPEKSYPKLSDILKPIKIYDETSLEKFLEEFPAKTVNEIKKEASRTVINDHSIYKLNKTLVLNFNYTKTIENYSSDLSTFEIVYIHGQAHNKINPINFGFGDEMDRDYQFIENKNKNEYLKFMKSFAYSNNSGYRKLLNFIEQDKFQVHILGHSCGLSDRTLLNTIFEHEFCRSIKVFYHKYKKHDANGNMDNYTDLVQNISRHFGKKKMMREKVVNKEYSDFLPQIDE
jgi:hypothetical protein